MTTCVSPDKTCLLQFWGLLVTVMVTVLIPQGWGKPKKHWVHWVNVLPSLDGNARYLPGPGSFTLYGNSLQLSTNPSTLQIFLQSLTGVWKFWSCKWDYQHRTDNIHTHIHKHHDSSRQKNFTERYSLNSYLSHLLKDKIPVPYV